MKHLQNSLVNSVGRQGNSLTFTIFCCTKDPSQYSKTTLKIAKNIGKAKKIGKEETAIIPNIINNRIHKLLE